MHFLRKSEQPHRGLVTGQPWACVTVRVEAGSTRLVVVTASIGLVKRDALFALLPPR